MAKKEVLHRGLPAATGTWPRICCAVKALPEMTVVDPHHPSDPHVCGALAHGRQVAGVQPAEPTGRSSERRVRARLLLRFRSPQGSCRSHAAYVGAAWPLAAWPLLRVLMGLSS